MEPTDDDLLWARGLGRRPAAALRLYCLPSAGAGASAFNAWSGALPPTVEVCAFQLPGRERRAKESPSNDLRALVERLADLAERHAERPFALYGHSLGALIAFELAHAVQRRGVPAAHLFVAAHRAPEQRRAEAQIRTLPDEELIAAIDGRYHAIPPEILREPQFLRLMLPVLRADFTLVETYAYASKPPLECGLTVLSGCDDAFTQDDDLGLWAAHTTGAFRQRTLPGGHFFPDTARNEFLAAVLEDLAPLL